MFGKTYKFNNNNNIKIYSDLIFLLLYIVHLINCCYFPMIVTYLINVQEWLIVVSFGANHIFTVEAMVICLLYAHTILFIYGIPSEWGRFVKLQN